MTLTPNKTQNCRPPPVADDPRWLRIVARDKTADGQLWYSVATTGVYCRPSCPSRTANPKNRAAARGLCKAPGRRASDLAGAATRTQRSLESENAALIAKACRIIEDSEEEPSLKILADAIDRSPSHFHRLFKAATGLSPKEYAAANRAKKIRQGLVAGNSVTEGDL